MYIMIIKGPWKILMQDKFSSHSSTIMKNLIIWGGRRGSVISQEVMCLGAHCVLGYIFSLLVFSEHHFQRMINNCIQ